MRPLPEALLNLARVQAGVLRSSQLADHGFTPRDVLHRIRLGDWQRISNRIVATQQPTRTSMLWAASLHHHRVGLTGASALELLGLPAAKDSRILLLGPRGTRQRPFEGCRIMTTEAPEFTIDAGPMRTPIAMSVALACGTASSTRQGIFYCTWAVQRRHTTLEAINDAVSALPNSPAMAAARRCLSLIDPGVHSVNEFDFARACKKRGLPQPLRQVARLDGEGRTRFTDVEFGTRSGTLVVEIDGLGHLDAEVRLDDQWRANELTLQSTRVLRVSALALRTDADRYFAQIRRALADLK